MGFGNAMNDMLSTGTGVAVLLAAATLPTTGAHAQAVPVPQETPRTIPGLVIAAPTPTPTRTPVPTPTGPVLGLPIPTPSETPSPDEPVRRAAPRRAAERTTTPAPTAPVDTPEAAASPTPEATTPIAPAPVMTPTPAATSTPMPMPVPVADEGDGNWPWLIGGAVPLVVALGIWAWLRRRGRPDDIAPEDPVPVAVAPAPTPVAPAPPIGPRAWIAVALRPNRAGLNMLSATVEAEVVVRNTGDAPATQVRIHATLLSAHAGQDADLAATFAAPAGRSAAPPFALAPGEERRVRIVAALSREAVRSMDAAGRPMFVPLVAIDVRYVADETGTPGRTGQAFIVGVERVDSAKLAPFWLDGPMRMHDQIAARAQGAAIS